MLNSLLSIGQSRSTEHNKLEALNAISANLMVADADYNITYMNPAVMSFLREAESDIRKDLPNFSVNGLIGSNIDVFHKNPAHQRGMLNRLTQSHKATINIGGRMFDLVASPLFDKAGKKTGIVVEWNDATLRIHNAESVALITAIGKSQAMIEFSVDGTILYANGNFLDAMGYTLDEIKGKHHGMFVDQTYKNSSEYRQFWDNLARGQFQAGEFKRYARDGKEVWLQASYNPLLDVNGKAYKVTKYAYDITQQKQESLAAIRLKLALDTSTANMMMADDKYNINYMNESLKGFLQNAEKDIQKDLPRFNVNALMGQNIDVFHKNPAHQRGMLEKLTTPYKTSILVGGRSFNLVANPVFGPNNERLGTVVEWQDGAALGQIEAINKSQAVIEFLLDGTILSANSNFLAAMGYSLDEVKGRHHSMFVDTAYKNSPEYRQFWESLARGEAQTAEFKRLAKGGREVWIQATYNPILDLRGKVVRVVKTATDVTQMVLARTENEKGMAEAVEVLQGVSAGNLTRKMEGEYHGTFAEIKKAMNATIDQLTEIVMNIISSADAVGSAASEISTGSADLSQRTEQQASNLEETAASMEEVTGTVKQNTENANNAKTLAQQANEVAEQGGTVVSKAVSAMGEIERSSQKIADIIGVIDEIAFQTNLLALNAAVEAARAGEAGKGFAVVAQEVRSLAGRSASASKEIKSLISESVGQVKSGAELVNHAGATLKDIVGAVRKVADIMNEIAAASVEQSTGIEEINNAVAQMDQMTQQNAALVEENTAAAGSLVDQSKALEEMIAFFKIGEEAGQSRLVANAGPGRAVQERKPAPKLLARGPSQSLHVVPRGKNVAAQRPTGKINAGPKPGGNPNEAGWEEF